MTKRRSFIKKLSKNQKITYLIYLLVIVLLLSIGIPSLARLKNRSSLITASVWDGSIASSYRKGTGTENDPYIISNGAELAYFSTQLASNNYENTYFALNSDIVLNNGIFDYDSLEGIKYTLNSQTYYINTYSNKYYDNANHEGLEIGNVNLFTPLNGFKGHFDGGSFRIYGLYVTNENSDQLALFTNLQGSITNLYVENSLIYGGINTAGIASTANNASLSNILFTGNVIGRSDNLNKNISTIPTISPIDLQTTQNTSYIDLTNNIPFIGSEIISTSITGNYTIEGATEAQTSIEINGITVTNGSFNIDLGTTILGNIPVVTSTSYEGVATITFSNLSYNIVYKYATSGGIVAISNNTTIDNTINKGDIYGYSTSGGIVGVTTNALTINQSYNTGDINSQYVSGGLVGTIEKSNDNITISKSYNAGNTTATDIGGLVGIINNNNGSINISNVFNTLSYSLGTISNTTVNVTNAYYTEGAEAINSGIINGVFISTLIGNLQTKNYTVNNLTFNEFIAFNDLETNPQNVWIYEMDSLPILFIDDLNNPQATINVSVYSWDNLSYDLSTVKLGSNITFSIEPTDELMPPKEIYYYISNSSTPLTATAISQISTWVPYSDIVQISEEGFYVIYAKVVDYNDNISYINTDLLILDLSGASVNVSINENTWSDLRSSLGNVYINRPSSITVNAEDQLSGIASIEYYITEEILSTTDLNALDGSHWTTYTDQIAINEAGTHIVYVKVTDNFNYVTYVNTNYIVFDGYTQNNLIIGRNASSYVNADPYITNKSTIFFNTTYSKTASDFSGYTHNLMSNILLPMGTKITLIDNISSKVFEYQVATSEDIYNYNNSCDVGDLDCIKTATYPFTLFKEVGTGNVNKQFTESSYYVTGTINENFTIILDLSNTDIVTNYNNVTLYMELHDSNSINVRPTLYSTIKTFNIYSNIASENSKASLFLTTDYLGDEIIFNSDSTTSVNINSGLTYKYIDSFRVTDTTYENKEIGLAIKLVDENDNIIDKEFLKNFIFKLGENSYYPENDNIIHINLNNGINDVNKTLSITTYQDNNLLEKGQYYLKISNYVSDDGYYYNELNNTTISIPVNVVNDNPNIDYSFDVKMDDTNRIINKTDTEVNVLFNILQAGSLQNPNIRVTLYKKDQLTAYNQSYSIVDLATYVSNNLNSYAPNIYYVSTNPTEYDGTESSYNAFALNLVTSNFENGGYKFVFSLYDDNKRIGTIEKYFIVR